MKDRNEIEKEGDRRYPRGIDTETILCRTAWVSGVESALKDSDEVAVAFAEALERDGYKLYKNGWSNDHHEQSMSTYHTTCDLLSLFKESNEYKLLKNK